MWPRRVVAELATHSAALPEIYLTSAVERRGIAELHETLGGFALISRTTCLSMSPMTNPSSSHRPRLRTRS